MAPIFRKHQWFKFKNLIFAAIAIALFFALLTVVIMMLGRKKLIDTHRVDDQVSYLSEDWLVREHTENGWKYSIHDMFMLPETFYFEKAPQTFRIVITGGSFAMGSRYVDQGENKNRVGGMADWAVAQLEIMYPSMRFELINAAAGAQNSNRVVTIVKRMAQIKPDLMIVATGNNEGYLPFSKANEALQNWAVYRLLKKTILPGVTPDRRQYFMPQDEDTIRIQKNFESNINEIIQTCKFFKTPLILATLPIHLKYEGKDPQVHGTSKYTASDEKIEQGVRLIKQGKQKAGIESLLESSNTGQAAFYLAQEQEKSGNYDLARTLYKVHVQNVPKNRTRPSFNDFIRNAAATNDVILLDLENAAEKISPDGIPGQELFFDFCHMNLTGYCLMGETLARTIAESGLISAQEGEPRPMESCTRIARSEKFDEKIDPKYPFLDPSLLEKVEKDFMSKKD